MKTEVVKNQDDLKRVSNALLNGEICALPTETVYGLAANIFDENAVKNIYIAKGRPSDNPLIVHISDIKMWDELVMEIPLDAKRLAEAFWPGPLTIILKKSEKVNDTISGGLDTVAVRCPKNEMFRKVIDLAKVPLAAPSANTSGKPSPTTAKHVIDDLDGKIPFIVDDGPCEVGVESTVITFCSKVPTILRPGAVTPEDIEGVIGKVEINKAVTEKLGDNEKAESPGMKYKHYSPNADVTILDGTIEQFAAFAKEHDGADLCLLCFDEDMPFLDGFHTLSFGSEFDQMSQANELFSRLREADDEGFGRVFSRMPKKSGVGLAVYNRLIRSAAFKVIKL